MALPGFIFDASKGETPQSLAKKRAIIQALMTSRRAPASVPEGIDALGDGIVANVLGRRADKAERDGQESAASAFGPIAGMIAGFPPAPAAPGAIPSGPLSKADPNVGSTIDFARSGMDGYLSNIRAAESGGNDAAKNPLSSATGRYQFTSGTWADVARKYPDLGLTPQGRLDPAQQERAIQAFTRDNAAVLSSARIPVTPGTLYAAHFLGSGGAQKVLSSEPDARVADIVGPEVVRANPFLRGMTVTDFVGWASQKGGGDTPINLGGGRTPPASFPAPEPAAPVQVASLDPSIGMPPTSDTMVPGQPASATPAGGRIVSAMTNPQPMTGGSPLPMQGMPAPQGASVPPVAQNSPAPVQTAQAAPMPEMAGNVAPMQGSGPTLQQLMQAASNPWLNDNQRQVVNMLLEQEMQKQDPMRQLQLRKMQQDLDGSTDPLEAEYKRAQIENLRSQIQERTDPNARDRFGNSVIWGQDSEGKWVAMQPSSGGGLVPALTPDGISLVPPGVSDMNLGTSYGIRDRAGNIISNVPIDNAGKARETKIGESQGGAAFDLPRVEQNADHTLDILSRMETHPGREGSTGFIQGLLPSRSSDQVDFQSLVDQTQGQSFLQAFQMLKGGGQITEVEGQKATDAISRLRNQRLSDKDYLQAIADLKGVINAGLERARKQAGGVAAPTQPAPTSDLKSKYGLD